MVIVCSSNTHKPPPHDHPPWIKKSIDPDREEKKEMNVLSNRIIKTGGLFQINTTLYRDDGGHPRALSQCSRQEPPLITYLKISLLRQALITGVGSMASTLCGGWV